jgi:hypothetical protein
MSTHALQTCEPNISDDVEVVPARDVDVYGAKE